jgi:hypothetical protein
VLEPFIRRVREGEQRGLVMFRFRHKATQLNVKRGCVEGVSGRILEPVSVERGRLSSRKEIGEFSFRAQAVIVTSGGIGGNHDLVRKNWPKRLGKPPGRLLSGVPDYVDGQMLGTVGRSGGNIINSDRMWHYPEGIQNYAPVWSKHAIRILSGPSPLWIDARGHRLPAPLYPGFDTLGALQHIASSGFDHSWFILNERIIKKEFALSGSEQNPDLTGRSIPLVLRRIFSGVPGPVETFKRKGADFVVRNTLSELGEGMNRLIGDDFIEPSDFAREIQSRDRDVDNNFGKDSQVTAIRGARGYFGDRLIRVVKPHRILEPSAGPLIAVRLSILTRKTLGGLETDLSARVLRATGQPIAGLYAAGEVAGFGGGGMHGYRALEGTFLGGCIFSGRIAGRAAASAVA